LGSEAAAVVGDAQGDDAAALLGRQQHGADARLAGRLALLRRLDPVTDGVPKQVDDGLGETFEDDAVELRLSPAQLELDLFSLHGGDVAHGAGEGARDRGERQHPHLDRRVLQLVDEPLSETELVLDSPCGLALTVERMLETAAVQDGLTDEVEQSVELLGRDSHGALLRRFSACGRARRLGRLSSGSSAATPLGKLVDERSDGLSSSFRVPAKKVDGAQQRLGEGGGQEARRTGVLAPRLAEPLRDRKSTRLNSSHVARSYAALCVKKYR